jgi:hypothetical protein
LPQRYKNCEKHLAGICETLGKVVNTPTAIVTEKNYTIWLIRLGIKCLRVAITEASTTILADNDINYHIKRYDTNKSPIKISFNTLSFTIYSCIVNCLKNEINI